MVAGLSLGVAAAAARFVLLPLLPQQQAAARDSSKRVLKRDTAFTHRDCSLHGVSAQVSGCRCGCVLQQTHCSSAGRPHCTCCAACCHVHAINKIAVANLPTPGAMARPMRILALFLLAQPILAQLTPPEPLAAAAAAHPARLFGAAAGQAHPRRLFGATQAGEAAPENHANARTVHASVSKFAHMLYDPAALAPPATPSQPHPAALSKEAVVAAAHAAALATLTRHSRSNPRHPFHAPRPFSPLFAGDACATLFVAVGVARTAGNTRAAALLLSKCQSACPIGYELDFTRRLCDVRPALRNTTFCAAAAAGDACQHGQRRLAGGWSDCEFILLRVLVKGVNREGIG